MSAPVLDSFADRLYDNLSPLTLDDETQDWALARFCDALGAMFQPVEDLARDTVDGPGWSAVLDLTRAPASWLPWLAQFVGVTIPARLTDTDEQRAFIAHADGFNRGTPAAIRAAAISTLTGSRVLFFRERDTGDPYRLEVITITSQTPDPDATERAVRAQTPAGLTLAYRTSDGQDYEQVDIDHVDYTAVNTDYTNYAAMVAGGLA